MSPTNTMQCFAAANKWLYLECIKVINILL